MKKIIVWTVSVIFLLVGFPAGARASEAGAPWWEQGKIRFFWGQWGRFNPPTEPGRDPREWSAENLEMEAEIMRQARAAGATVFVDHGCFTQQLPPPGLGDYLEGGSFSVPGAAPFYSRRGALARAQGLRYFVPLKTTYITIAENMGEYRSAVNRHGRTAREERARGMNLRGDHVPCPLDARVVEEWLLKSALAAAENGVDGLHIDWESYGYTGYDQMGEYLCYCDSCWEEYARGKGISERVAKADRYEWLRERGLNRDYLGHRRDALIALYRGIAERVRAVNPEFIFTAYPDFTPGEWETAYGWRVEGAALGLHDSAAPTFVIDASHYNPNRNAPFWESGYNRIRALGMKHILGSWDGTWYGRRPYMEISFARWMYETAMSHDGDWLWFEHRLGPDDYTHFRAAQRAIAAVESRAGAFFARGRPDFTFISLSEQGGDETLRQRVRQRAWRLDGRHLAWVINANSEHSLSVLARFPRLEPDRSWSVRDLLSGQPYTLDGRRRWSSADLAAGLVLALEKRSDAWLVIAPYAENAEEVERISGSLSGDVIRAHPPRPALAGGLPPAGVAAGGFPLVYTRRNQRSFYQGGHYREGLFRESTNPVAGTSLHLIDASSPESPDKLLFDIDGWCRTPALSPDRTRIAFSCWVNGRGQICLVDTGGAHPRNISNNEYRDTGPVWSPDGEKMAFLSDRDGDWQIFVMNADGSDPRRLTQGPGEARDPAWSPCAEKIAYVHDRGGDFNLYVIGADGSGERRLLDRGANMYEPSWSPDGRKIACVSGIYGYHQELMIVDAADGSLEYPQGFTHAMRGWFAYTQIRSLSWSPDGTRLAGAFERLRRHPDHPGDEGPGTAGIFVATLGQEAAEARVVDIGFDDDAVVKTAGLKEIVAVEPLMLKPGGSSRATLLLGGWYRSGDASRHWLTREFDAVRWSPDGRSIAFRSDMDPSGYDFYFTVPAVGGEPVRLENTLSPMRADGAHIPVPLFGAAAADPYAWLAAAGRRLLLETPELWMFRTDPEQVGESEQWFNASPADPGWTALSTRDFWVRNPRDPEKYYIGWGWYVTDLVLPDAGGKRVWVHFEGVDENYTLWINGEYIGDNMAKGPSAWDQPFSEEITGRYRPGRVNRIAVRARNTTGAGGIWKPVFILTELGD